MPVMVLSRRTGDFGKRFPTILLASDSEELGSFMHGLLEEEGFATRYAGVYAELGNVMAAENFDVVLIEVTTVQAVEAAVAAALQVKRANPGQFVGYLADPALDTAGLAGDAVFPRTAAKLPGALRAYFADAQEVW